MQTTETPYIPQIVEREVLIRKQDNFDAVMRDHMSQVYSAIGYLSNWSGSSFPRVALICSTGRDTVTRSDVEIMAYFYKPDGTVGYVIGGIWHESEQSFSFHS